MKWRKRKAAGQRRRDRKRDRVRRRRGKVKTIKAAGRLARWLGWLRQ